MKKFVLNDFNSVQKAWEYVTNGKMPMWAITIMYIILLPLGIVLLPLALFMKTLLCLKLHFLLQKTES